MAPVELQQQPQTPAAEQQVDLRQYWRVVLRRKFVVIGTFITVALLGAAYTFRLPKVYSATSTIIMEMTAPKVIGNGQVQDVADNGTPFWASKEYFETQYSVMKSRVVAERVVKKLRSGRDDKLLMLDQVENEEAKEKGLKALQNFRGQMAAHTDPAAMLLGRLSVEPVKESRIARLSVDDIDPLMAAALANSFTDAYMEFNLESKAQTTGEATESLESRLPDLDDKVQETQQQLTDFKKQHDVGASFEEKQKLVDERINRINGELINVRIKKAQFKARNDAIAAMEKAANADDVQRAAQVPESVAGAAQQLKMRLIETSADCEQLSERLGPEHPKMVDCRIKERNAKKAFDAEVGINLGRAQAEYANAVGVERNLLEELSQARSDAQELANLEPAYAKLKRAHDTNTRLYEVALKSLKESGLSDRTRLNNISVLDAARPILAPTKPNVRNNMVAALFIGLVLGFLLAFGLEFLDNTITTQEQIEERLGLSFLGILPTIGNEGDGDRDLMVHTQPKSAAAECCRAVRTNLLFMSPERPLKSILVTSAGPRDGKTTSAVSLAITMAESGNRVLLVDADLRRPRVHQAFKVPNGAGLSSLILGEGKLKDTVKSSGVSNLSILTCGPVPPNPAELLHTDSFKALLGEMMNQYDRVIIDSPPVGAVADAVVVSTQVDGTLVVVKSGVTSRDMARRAVRALRDVNARIFGAILNDINLEDRQAGGYYYYSKYGYYYGEPETKKSTAA